MPIPRLVPLVSGTQSDYAVGVEQGAIYVITGPDGTRAVFNSPGDRDHVGFLTDLPQGLDSADTRESADVIPEGDGGSHGAFYLGRRPIVFTGMIDPYPSVDDYDLVGGVRVAWSPGRVANRRMNRLQRASRALRGDGTLAWVPSTAPPVSLRFRRQSGPRFGKRLPKTFTLGLVAEDPRIYGQSIKGTTAFPATVRNEGNYDTPPTVTFRNAWTNPAVTLSGIGTATFNVSLVTNDVLAVDFGAKVITLNGARRQGLLARPASRWWYLQPGDNAVSVSGVGAGGTASLSWRDAWGG